MQPLFGMAGLAEAAWAGMIVTLWFGTFVVAVLALVALVFRSRIAAVACLLVDVVGAFFLGPLGGLLCRLKRRPRLAVNTEFLAQLSHVVALDFSCGGSHSGLGLSEEL